MSGAIPIFGFSRRLVSARFTILNPELQYSWDLCFPGTCTNRKASWLSGDFRYWEVSSDCSRFRLICHRSTFAHYLCGVGIWRYASLALDGRYENPFFWYFPNLQAVADYYDELLPRLVPRLLDRVGNILMIQVENEYGSYGEDRLPERFSRRCWTEALIARSLHRMVLGRHGWARPRGEEDLFVRISAPRQIIILPRWEFVLSMAKNGPLMCMEFWDGWISIVGKSQLSKDPEEWLKLSMSSETRLYQPLYVSWRYTNLASWMKTSARGYWILQVTSYDYDAPARWTGKSAPKSLQCKNDENLLS